MASSTPSNQSVNSDRGHAPSVSSSAGFYASDERTEASSSGEQIGHPSKHRPRPTYINGMPLNQQHYAGHYSAFSIPTASTGRMPFMPVMPPSAAYAAHLAASYPVAPNQPQMLPFPVPHTPLLRNMILQRQSVRHQIPPGAFPSAYSYRQQLSPPHMPPPPSRHPVVTNGLPHSMSAHHQHSPPVLPPQPSQA